MGKCKVGGVLTNSKEKMYHQSAQVDIKKTEEVMIFEGKPLFEKGLFVCFQICIYLPKPPPTNQKRSMSMHHRERKKRE